MKKIYLVMFILSLLKITAQNPGLVISEVFVNPAGTDSCKEYVELLATQNINFSLTPYTVIVNNNGTANANGWISGGALSYAFAITSGTVLQGAVVYVGGSCMTPTVNQIRIINVKNTNGDGGIGNANSTGVFGNGGANADGIAVFNTPIASITSSTVPTDALFWGTGIGTASVTSTTGYQLPINDFYTGGKVIASSYLASDPGPDIITLTGIFNTTSNSWQTPRSFAITSYSNLTTSSSVSLTTMASVSPPVVTSVSYINATNLKVAFNKTVTLSSASTTTNYTITPLTVINTASLLASSDSVKITTSSSFSIGSTYSITINNITEQTGVATMTTAQTFTFVYTGIKFKKYTWKNPQAVGNFQGQQILNGGISGLQYIAGTNNEYYAITDRGPNLDANTNNHAITLGGVNNSAKLFPFPNFNPNAMRVKLQGDSIVYLSNFSFKRPNGSLTTGLINPPSAGGTGEIALVDTNGTQGIADVWGFDCEGITNGNNKDYWVSEEYGVSIWHTDSTGKAIERYTPYGAFPLITQPQDVAIDTIFKFRNPNKGFEGVAFAPNKKVYGFLQNTILFPASDINLKKNTRLHRFIEIDTRTNTTRMLAYEHDKKNITGPFSSINNDKRYIGDAVSVNNNEFLILEHGKSTSETYGKVYLISIAPATTINAVNHLIYSGGTKSFEQLLDSTTAASEGVTVVKKTLLVDLIANGFDPSIEKKEGLTIVNDTTIAIANDNDFGVVSTSADGVMSQSGLKSYIYVFTLPPSKKLNICNNVSIATVGSSTICLGDSTLLTTPNIAGITYAWKKNNVTIAGATTNSYYAKQTGNYELFATNSLSCTAISNTKNITVSVCTGLASIDSKLNYNIYPNPTKNSVNLIFNNTNAKTINIINLLGQTIISQNTTNINLSVDVNSLVAGVYFINVTINNKTVTKKLIIE